MQEALCSRIGNIALKSDPAQKRRIQKAEEICQMWEEKLKGLSKEFKSEKKSINENPGWYFLPT